ncbi:MAG: hypothetical protein KJO34_03740, partial [Deltaproteobacteria bacterium]|nr:hypothetical protein [Deltaproteobacteria bacterium]
PKPDLSISPLAKDGETESSQKPITAGAPAPSGEENTLVLANKDAKPADRRAEPTAGSTYSKILGRIALKRNENLSGIIQQVYGGFTTRYFKSFILANPDIEDPDLVEVGQIISLPAIAVKAAPGAKPVWWVKVDETDKLETAFNILRDRSDGSYPVRLIPYWTPANGTKFAVVLNKIFENEYSARSHLQQLPAELTSNSTILSAWDKKTVYFADPFFGRKY